MFPKFFKLFMGMLFPMVAFMQSANAGALYRVNSSYEDTIRIAFIWNDAQGSVSCQSSTTPVGQKTLDFALSSLDTSKVKNVKILQNSLNKHVKWSDVEALWGNGVLPHNIVHINAGWSIGPNMVDVWNGAELDTIFSRAVQNKIGIVSIGDDAASLATNTFGFDSVENVPQPLGDGMSIDSLWIGLLRQNDEKLKTYVTGTTLQYPGLNGIVSNTIDSILKGEILPFFPAGEGRCQADADKYNIRYPQWITMLGYQQGYDNGQNVNGSNELNVLVAIQDTIQKKLIRRAVALSFQPQFLRNSTAAQQLVYDAIMFTSLTHTLSIPSKIYLTVASDSVKAGDRVQVNAELYDQNNIPMVDKLSLVQWKLVNPSEGDSLHVSIGALTELSATLAWRTVTVEADFTDPETNVTVRTTATVFIKPGDPDHVDISSVPEIATNDLNKDLPSVTVQFSRSQTTAGIYAFIRDRFQNYVSNGGSGIAWSSNDNNVVTVAGSGTDTWIGAITKVEGGVTYVVARSGDLIADTADVEVAGNAFVRICFTRDNDGDGYIDMIELQFDSKVILADQSQAVNDLKVSHEGAGFPVTGIALKSGVADSIVLVSIQEDITRGLQTDWKCQVQGTIPVILNEKQDLYTVKIDKTAQDGVGPVLQQAVYVYNARDGQSDSVFLILSEPVKSAAFTNLQPQEAFLYYNFKNGFESAELLKNGTYSINYADEYVTTVKVAVDMSVVRTIFITPYKDSMQFVGGVDINGNVAPSKELSRKVVLESSGNNSITVTVYPNPLDFDKIKIDNFPDELKTWYKNVIGDKKEGMLIAVKTIKTLKEQNGSYGNIKIYDSMGNIVAKNINLKQAATPQDYGILWDGLNQNGRRVAPGSYLMVLSTFDEDNRQYVDKRKIGISMN